MKLTLSCACKAFLLLAALSCASSRTHAQEPNADIYGKWKIKAMIGGGAASILSQRQVAQLIGKIAIINAERFEFNGRVCTYPSYERSQEETSSHFDREWRTEVNDIPFPNPVTIIETGCNTLYPIREGHLMIAKDGAFFEAVRISKTAGQLSHHAK